MPDEQDGEDRLPYVSFTTLLNFLERWGDGVIPPRIDKSALDTYSGGTQALLLTTLRSAGFIDAEGNVQAELREAITSESARKAHLATWARRIYAEQLRLAEQNATSQMLVDSFAPTKYQGSTLRKAVVFYLALVDYLDLPNSPLFRAPKQSRPAARQRRRELPPEPAVQPAVQPLSPAAPRGETTVIQIAPEATITITVDAQWMKLPVETITSMRDAISKLEALASGVREYGPAGEEVEAGPSNGSA